MSEDTKYFDEFLLPVFSTQEETVVVEDILEEVIGTSTLIVHNDEVNTFEYVIQALVDILKMAPEQAEQCTLIIHFKGKYAVKHGSKEELKPLKDGFSDRGIGATIE